MVVPLIAPEALQGNKLMRVVVAFAVFFAAYQAEIIRAGVPRVAYVSCNPVSFARDVQNMVAAGYRLDWVQVVDQFRWSSHVELSACLTLPEG